jgi:multidrug transporter EmrE-like cation transporter
MKGFRVTAFILGHLALNTLANASYKLSSMSSDWRRFLLWQIIGNLSGFVGVLVFTGLLRLVPLHVAHPVTQGLAVIGVQVVAAWILFRETIGPFQWAGSGLVIVGIALISTRPGG